MESGKHGGQEIGGVDLITHVRTANRNSPDSVYSTVHLLHLVPLSARIVGNIVVYFSQIQASGP